MSAHLTGYLTDDKEPPRPLGHYWNLDNGDAFIVDRIDDDGMAYGRRLESAPPHTDYEYSASAEALDKFYVFNGDPLA